MSSLQPHSVGKVLVTGAAGFIGRHVVRALVDEGWRVVALQHRSPLPHSLATRCERVISGDINDPEVRLNALDRVEVVCHLSAYIPARNDTLNDAEQCNRINGVGAVHLAEESAQCGVRRFVHISAANMYTYSPVPRVESDPVFPSLIATAYFVSKLAAEVYLSNVSRRTGMTTLILRVATPYGPGEPVGKVIPTFLRLAAQGKPLAVSDGGIARFSYVHVEDVAMSVLNAARSGDSGLYNIASGEHTSLLELAELIVAMPGHGRATLNVDSITPDAWPGFAPISIDKARDEWHFAPRPLTVGLRQYRDHLFQTG